MPTMTTSVTNAAPVLFPDNANTSSTVVVAGLTQPVVNVRVTLHGFEHTSASDMDFLLVAPDGVHNLLFMSDAIPTNQSEIDLIFSDSAEAFVPYSSAVVGVSATFRPTDYESVETASTFGVPPALSVSDPGPNGTATFVSAFGGIAPNGSWTLYAHDDDPLDFGQMSGWTLTLSTGIAPIASPSAFSTNEDVSSSGQLVATDADSDPLTYQIVDKPLHGTVSLQPDGQYTYTPFANYSGSDSFTFNVNDGGANSGTAAVSVTINKVNDAPAFVVGPGKFTTDFASGTAGVALQADGKIVIVGTDSSIARYNSDGTLDTSFGSGGVVAAGALPDGAVDILIQPDGKILLAGSDSGFPVGDFSVVRFNSDGSIDTTFGGGDGKGTIHVDGTVGPTAQNFPRAMALQSDGKIVVVGSVNNLLGAFQDYAAVRFNADGTPDTTFDGDGAMYTPVATTTDEATSVAIQSDGKIVIAGHGLDFGNDSDISGLVRLNPDGSVDKIIKTSWGNRQDDFIDDVVLQPDGKALIVGYTRNTDTNPGDGGDIVLLRYTTALDPSDPMDHSFGISGSGRVIANLGISSFDEGVRALILPDGKIMVAAITSAGGHPVLALARFNADGSFDTTFGDGGKATTQFAGINPLTADMVMQPDGKLLVVGNFGSFPGGVALVRYNLDGSIDQTFKAANTLDGAPIYVQGGASVVLDSDVLVYDAELQVSANSYFNATLTLVRDGGADASDAFGFNSGVTLDGNIVSVGESSIAVVNQNSGGQLVMRFLASARQDTVEAVMHAITYSNNAPNAPSSVQIGWTFSDGNTTAQGPGGAKTATGSTTVTIQPPPNDAPTDIDLSNAAVAENSANGSIVGALSDIDPNAGDTAAYTLTDDAGGRFAISGSDLVVANGALLDFESNTSHSVTVRVSDSGGLTFDEAFAIAVTNANETPADIALSNATVAENSANGTIVGALSDVDPDAGDTAAYTLTDDAGGRFGVSGNNLVVADGTLLDFESNASHSVTVRVTDSGGLTFDRAFSIAVTDVSEIAPDAKPHWMKSVGFAPHPAGWSPAGTGDFNADGTSDVAWYNSSTGNIDIWKFANDQWEASVDAGSHPGGYQPVSFVDFNHDNTSDVLWFNPTTGHVDLWKIADGQWAGSVDVGTHPTGWQPAGFGDFNGDGTSDIAWYNPTTNAIDIWKIVDGQWAGSVDVGSHPAGYQPALTGDFNGDGTSDIAWFNQTTGDVDIWQLSDGQWAGSTSVGAHPAGWQPLGAADFNQDGTSDIAWYNPTTNNIDIWLIENGQWAGSVDIGTHPAGWVAVGLGDFDQNGVSDIMWHNASTGEIDNWMLAFS